MTLVRKVGETFELQVIDGDNAAISTIATINPAQIDKNLQLDIPELLNALQSCVNKQLMEKNPPSNEYKIGMSVELDEINPIYDGMPYKANVTDFGKNYMIIRFKCGYSIEYLTFLDTHSWDTTQKFKLPFSHNP